MFFATIGPKSFIRGVVAPPTLEHILRGPSVWLVSSLTQHLVCTLPNSCEPAQPWRGPLLCTPFPPKKKHAGQPHAAQSCAPGHLHFSFCFVAAFDFEAARQLFEYMRQLFGPWGAFLFSARQAEDISDEEKNLHHRPAAQPIKQTGLLKLTSLPFMTKSSSASWGFGLRALRSSTLHTAPHPIHTYVAPLGGKGAARWLLKSPPFFLGWLTTA